MLNLINLLAVGYVSITPNYDIGRSVSVNELCKISSGNVIYTEIDEVYLDPNFTLPSGNIIYTEIDKGYVKHIFISGKDGIYEILKKEDDNNKHSLENIITTDRYDYLISMKYLPTYWMYFENLRNLHWESNICEPNVSQEKEVELKTNYLTSYITSLYKKKPDTIPKLKAILESIDLSKYSEKTKILTEIVKKIIDGLMK